VPGVASTIDLDRLRAAADQSATLRAMLMRHGMAIYAQIQQTAGYATPRTRWNPGWRDVYCTLAIYPGSDQIVLTQESMAQMIGARRNSVSLVANTLQQANFIRYSRDTSRSPIWSASATLPANAMQRSRPSTKGCFLLVACRARWSRRQAGDPDPNSGIRRDIAHSHDDESRPSPLT